MTAATTGRSPPAITLVVVVLAFVTVPMSSPDQPSHCPASARSRAPPSAPERCCCS
ncbi:hypothetical protein ACFQVA_05660 [Actinomadura keratinilytica]